MPPGCSGALRCAGPARGGHAAPVPHPPATQSCRHAVRCWLFLSQKTCSTHGPERGPSCRKSHRFLRTKTQLSPTRTHFHMEGSLPAKHDKMQTPHLVPQPNRRPHQVSVPIPALPGAGNASGSRRQARVLAECELAFHTPPHQTEL